MPCTNILGDVGIGYHYFCNRINYEQNGDDPYREAEQQYKITVGYVIENGKSVPYKIFYTDEQTNKRTEIPSKNVTIQHISDSIYEIYVRIKRQDGDGYDYAIAKLKKISDTEYRTVKVEVGREVI